MKLDDELVEKAANGAAIANGYYSLFWEQSANDAQYKEPYRIMARAAITAYLTAAVEGGKAIETTAHAVTGMDHNPLYKTPGNTPLLILKVTP